MTTRVAVVDDHPIFRDGLATLVETTDDFELVGAVADGPEIVALVSEQPVDVVLMDLSLPTMSGVDATARITSRSPSPAVLVVTMVDDDDTVVAALRAGARGYVLKGAPGDEIVAAVRTVAAGGAVFGAGVAGQVLALTGDHHKPVAAHDDDLTERERQILELLAEGMSNAQIARRLDLSLKTVQNYVSRILDKLQVADRTQAALRARDSRGA
ncbi:MAG TPA: response regulator transcription factor [Mycobacteriales bacterium]|nr:response regulator transcription factor [Mycobacteriales bacterium]